MHITFFAISQILLDGCLTRSPDAEPSEPFTAARAKQRCLRNGFEGEGEGLLYTVLYSRLKSIALCPLLPALQNSECSHLHACVSFIGNISAMTKETWPAPFSLCCDSTSYILNPLRCENGIAEVQNVLTQKAGL